MEMVKKCVLFVFLTGHVVAFGMYQEYVKNNQGQESAKMIEVVVKAVKEVECWVSELKNKSKSTENMKKNFDKDVKCKIKFAKEAKNKKIKIEKQIQDMIKRNGNTINKEKITNLYKEKERITDQFYKFDFGVANASLNAVKSQEKINSIKKEMEKFHELMEQLKQVKKTAENFENTTEKI